MYEYDIGDTVTVMKEKRDPGGTGTVTARSHMEDSEGVAVRYRVLIPASRYQIETMKRSRRSNGEGLWYAARRVSS